MIIHKKIMKLHEVTQKTKFVKIKTPVISVSPKMKSTKAA